MLANVVHVIIHVAAHAMIAQENVLHNAQVRAWNCVVQNAYRIVKTHANLHAKVDAETTVMAVVQQHVKEHAQVHVKMAAIVFASLRACLLVITTVLDVQGVIMHVKKDAIHSVPVHARPIVMDLAM